MVQRRPTEIVQVNLRLRENFRKQIQAAADKAGRSFNQEVVHRLEQSFNAENIDAIVRRAVSDTGAVVIKEVRKLRDTGRGDE
jgi:uncharacterized protein (DUF1778 family)